MGVDTKTICPFPKAVPVGRNATSVADCTITYGEALGAGHIILQVFLLAVSTTGLVVFTYRIYRLYMYCLQKKTRFWDHNLLVHFVWSFLFNFFLLLGSIDVFGFWG